MSSSSSESVQKEVTEFTSWILEGDEYILAATFTDLQVKHLQTTLAKFAVTKISTSAETYENPELFVRAHEYQRGLIDGIKYLLELNDGLKKEYSDVARRRVVNQIDDEAPDWRRMAL